MKIFIFSLALCALLQLTSVQGHKSKGQLAGPKSSSSEEAAQNRAPVVSSSSEEVGRGIKSKPQPAPKKPVDKGTKAPKVTKAPAKRARQGSLQCYNCTSDNDNYDCIINPTKFETIECRSDAGNPFVSCMAAVRTSSDKKKPFFRRGCMYLEDNRSNLCGKDMNYDFCTCDDDGCNKCVSEFCAVTPTNDCNGQKYTADLFPDAGAPK